MTLQDERLPKSSYSDYLSLIHSLVRCGYSFELFDDIATLTFDRGPFVLMRHDVDMDLERALSLARFEALHSIRSTYFVMLTTPLYNVLSRDGSEAVRNILALGHRIGLHFDCAAYPDAGRVVELNALVRNEAEILASWFQTPIQTVSFHRPNALVLEGDGGLAHPLRHTYEPIFTRRIKYVSDSGGQWKYGNPISSDAFLKREPLHILTHPIWWDEQTRSPIDTLASLCEKKKEDLHRALAENCKVFRPSQAEEATKRSFHEAST